MKSTRSLARVVPPSYWRVYACSFSAICRSSGTTSTSTGKVSGLGRSQLKEAEALALFCACRHRKPPSVSYVMYILRTQQRTRQAPLAMEWYFPWVRVAPEGGSFFRYPHRTCVGCPDEIVFPEGFEGCTQIALVRRSIRCSGVQSGAIGGGPGTLGKYGAAHRCPVGCSGVHGGPGRKEFEPSPSFPSRSLF